MKMPKRISVTLLCSMLALPIVALEGCASTPTREGTGEYLDDTVLTGKVKASLFNEASIKSSEINVETFKGDVQLSGFVSSPDEAQRAVAVARSVNGVKSVRNDMIVK
ncbi:MAG: BON domain-containing protein [Pseudomonadota bacterium]